MIIKGDLEEICGEAGEAANARTNARRIKSLKRELSTLGR